MPKLQNLMAKEELKMPCRHYWIIDTPNGDMSLGYCKYCGKVQEFSNLTTRSRYLKKVSNLRIPNQDNTTAESIDDE